VNYWQLFLLFILKTRDYSIEGKWGQGGEMGTGTSSQYKNITARYVSFVIEISNILVKWHYNLHKCNRNLVK